MVIYLLVEILMIVVLILSLLFFIIYNKLAEQRNRVGTTWAQIEVHSCVIG